MKRNERSHVLLQRNGRILRVDLNRGTWGVETLPEAIILDYLGGRGFTAKYCYDEIPPHTDPKGRATNLYSPPVP